MDRAPPEPVHRGVLVVDIQGYGRKERRDPDRIRMRQALLGLLDQALRGSGIDPGQVEERSDLGDGLMLVAKPGVSTARLIAPMADLLVEELARHNQAEPERARLRLRMVVHAGELVADAGSFVSEDLTHAFRLLGSDVAHACLAQTSADLALIVSDWAYDKLVRHGFFGLDPADFQPVLVVAKETRTRAWVRVPGHNRRLDLPAPPEAPGSGWALPLRPSDPERIGPYELAGRLGSGGMGTVYLGLDSNGRRVAVKVLRADHAEDPTFRERFRREVEAARRVPRFCTAPVVGTGGGGQPYLATEYVDGPSLEAAVETGGPLPAGDLEGLGLGMALALTAIHGTGLVHRDLTPGNVLLSRLGPRVIDFGIASALEGTSLHTQGPIGTPSYMAPEQAMGKRVTFAADVFAWGCVVAYAASGRPPFGTGPPGAVTYRVMHEPPDLRGLEGPLRGLVEAAVQKEPQRRPTTAQLLDRLRGPATVPGSAANRVLTHAGERANPAVGRTAAGTATVPTARRWSRMGANPAALRGFHGRRGWLLTLLVSVLVVLGALAWRLAPPIQSDHPPTTAAEPLVVPVVAGLNPDTAESVVGQAGFRVGRAVEPSETVPAGDLIRTWPAAGTREPRQAWVWVIASSGPRGPFDSDLDLCDNADKARWTTGAGRIPFGPPQADREWRQGYALRSATSDKLEDGTAPGKLLMTHPQWVDNGFIQSSFQLPAPIRKGDRFISGVGFIAGANAEVDFAVWVNGGPLQRPEQVVSIHDATDGIVRRLDVDLSRFAGATELQLAVYAGPTAAQDWATWVAPRIERGPR